MVLKHDSDDGRLFVDFTNFGEAFEVYHFMLLLLSVFVSHTYCLMNTHVCVVPSFSRENGGRLSSLTLLNPTSDLCRRSLFVQFLFMLHI